MGQSTGRPSSRVRDCRDCREEEEEEEEE